MTQLPDFLKYNLADGQTVELSSASMFEIACLAGIVWITQPGELRDTVLQAGESVVLDRHGPALIGAIGGAARVQAASLHHFATAA